MAQIGVNTTPQFEGRDVKTEACLPNHNNETRRPSNKSGLICFLRVFRYNTVSGHLLNAIAVVCMVASGVILPLMDVVFGQFVSIFTDFSTGKLSQDHYLAQVGNFTVYFVYLFLAKFSLTYAWTVLINVTAIRTTTALRVDFVRQTLRQEISFFDTPASSISGQITTNGNLINYGISEKLGLIVQALSMFVTAFVVAFKVQWKLALICLAIVPLNTIVTLGGIYIDALYEHRMFDIYGESSTLAQEAFSTIRNVHSFWAFSKLTERFEAILERAGRVGAKKSPVYAVLFPIEFFSVIAGYALAFWQGIRMYSAGEIQHAGTVVTVIFAILVAAQALTQIAPQTVAIAKAIAAAQELFAIIDRESSIDSMSPSGVTLGGFRGEIEFRGVRFSYPARPSVPVHHDLSLNIPAGKTTAVVGASGSGKSTLFGIIERWYPYSSGAVTVDGVPIQDLNLRWLRTNIRLVQQEPTLFSGTVLQNVLDGLTGTTLAGLTGEQKLDLAQNACKAAFAHDFVQRLPNGYDTWIGERGASLSGGQRQRIVIARSIISNPKVLLLDEATSALDPAAERVVQAALNNVAKGRTMVVIAHRLSTIRDADNIIVMAKGEIMESGSHAELLRKHGTYARLAQSQDLGQGGAHSASHGQDVSSAPEKLVSYQAEELTVEDHEQSYNLLHGLLLILKEQKELWLPCFVIALCCIIGGGSYPALALLFSRTMVVFEELDLHSGDFYALMFFVVALVNFLLYGITGWLSNVVAQAIMKYYRAEIFDSTLRQDMTFFDRPANGTGALVGRLDSEPTSLQELLSINLSLLVICLVNLFASCVVAIATGWKLGLAMTLGALPFIVGAGYMRIRLEFRFEQDTVDRFARSSAIASEAVMAIRTVSSLALEQAVVDRYHDKLRGIARHAILDLGWKMLFYALSQSTSLLAMALGFWYGSRLVATGEYSSGQFYTVFIAIIFSGEAAALFFQFTTSITRARTAINYIFRLRRGRAMYDGGPHNEKPAAEAEMSFSNVKFSYPLRPSVPVLRGINLAIKPGSMTALVGASGCGKSTMIGLLERFYDPTSGELRAYGQEVKSWDRRTYRSGIALVQQEPVLYQGSIRDNISLGADGGASDTEVMEACRNANIWSFVASLPEGLDTPCGSQGLSLSGGQRQRIAIARALVRKPRLLLLDEATSALDTESEQAVKEALDRAAQGRTTVAVAHRLSTIRDADVIAVFENGDIAELGSHDELVARRGTYYGMVLGQSLDRE